MSEKGQRIDATLRDRLVAALKLSPQASDDAIVALVTHSRDIHEWEVAISAKVAESGGALTRDMAAQVLQAQKSTRITP